MLSCVWFGIPSLLPHRLQKSRIFITREVLHVALLRSESDDTAFCQISLRACNSLHIYGVWRCDGACTACLSQWWFDQQGSWSRLLTSVVWQMVSEEFSICRMEKVVKSCCGDVWDAFPSWFDYAGAEILRAMFSTRLHNRNEIAKQKQELVSNYSVKGFANQAHLRSEPCIYLNQTLTLFGFVHPEHYHSCRRSSHACREHDLSLEASLTFEDFCTFAICNCVLKVTWNSAWQCEKWWNLFATKG